VAVLTHWRKSLIVGDDENDVGLCFGEWSGGQKGTTADEEEEANGGEGTKRMGHDHEIGKSRMNADRLVIGENYPDCKVLFIRGWNN
jgi:hypothetical protein